MISKFIPKVIYQYNVGSYLVAESENEEYIKSLERKFPKAEYGVFFLKYFLDIDEYVLSISIKGDELFYNYSETTYDDWDGRAPLTSYHAKSYSEVMNLINENQRLNTLWEYVKRMKEVKKALKEDYHIPENTALEAYDKFCKKF